MKKEYRLLSADDRKTKIHGVQWLPDWKPAAVLQICHGMCEYIERYEEFAEFLTHKGIAVFGHDHIGHGDSVEKPEERGIFHTQDPLRTCVEDIFSNYRYGKKKFPDIPYFILGHSMGSYLLRTFLTQKSDRLHGLNGAVIMGTGNVERSMAGLGQAVLKVISKSKGWDAKVPFVAKLQYNSSYKGFSKDGIEPEKSWLSTNVESVEKFYKDPKDTFAFSINGYKLLLGASGFSGQKKNIAKIKKDLPVLLLSGQDDPVGDLGRGVKITCRKFKDAGIKDVSMHLFKHMRHELLQEVDRQKVFLFIYHWMRERM